MDKFYSFRKMDKTDQQNMYFLKKPIRIDSCLNQGLGRNFKIDRRLLLIHLNHYQQNQSKCSIIEFSNNKDNICEKQRDLEISKTCQVIVINDNFEDDREWQFYKQSDGKSIKHLNLKSNQFIYQQSE